MVIKIIYGKVLCNFCERPLESYEAFKINEHQFEIACLECDDKYKFSERIIIKFETKQKTQLLNLIQKAVNEKRTFSIGIEDKAKKRVFENFFTPLE